MSDGQEPLARCQRRGAVGLEQLLSILELESTLIQADALHTTQAFFAGASPRGPTCP
jgi:hypothetical protein